MRDEADLEIGSRSQPDAAQMDEPDPVLPEPVRFGPGSPRKVDELEREIWLGGEAVDSGLDLGWEGAAAVANPNVARCATLRPVTEAASAAEAAPGEAQQGEGAADGEGEGADGEAADEGEFRFFYESVVPNPNPITLTLALALTLTLTLTLALALALTLALTLTRCRSTARWSVGCSGAPATTTMTSTRPSGPPVAWSG